MSFTDIMTAPIAFPLLLFVVGIFTIGISLGWIFDVFGLDNKTRDDIMKILLLALIVWGGWQNSLQQKSLPPSTVPLPTVVQDVVPSIYLPLVTR